MAAPIISLTELLTPRSAQQIINDFFAYLANPPDPSLVSVRTSNWRTGGPYRFLAYRQGIEASLLYQVIASFAGSSFLRYASGKWLDWLGQDFFSEPRQGAQFATVTIQVTIPAGAGPYGPLRVTAQTTDGKSFSSVALATLPAGPAVVSVPMRAAQAGVVYNVGPNTVTQLITPNVLGISVTNAAAAIGGFDAEPDVRYRQRLAAKWGVLSTGSTAAAYTYWALTASPEVQKVKVYSDLNGAGGFADEAVTVVVSGATAPVSGGALAAVAAYIGPRVPLDVTLYTINATPYPVVVTGTAFVYLSFVSSAAASIATSLQALAARVPIGSYDQGPVPVEQFESAVAYDQTQVYDVALVFPGTEIALAYNELLTISNTLSITGV